MEQQSNRDRAAIESSSLSMDAASVAVGFQAAASTRREENELREAVWLREAGGNRL